MLNMIPAARLSKNLERWLYIVAIGHILLGFALPVLAFSSGFDFYAGQLRDTFWGAATVPAEALAFQRWIVALFGPTVASWGILMAYLVRAGVRSKEQWPWNGLLLSLIAWAPLDIAISLLHGFWLHVAIDIVAVTLIAVPALILRMARDN
ncbi:MAG: hypothetical protein B7Y56_09330 [Gallionellales bacterium 35-53-114]|jgi:hypothetical protein|nr:MAG: hypothetical protein B7Y56_09330 [Gallionellales bacterium 35-53-114]OYZ62824.1 MAG: hypothetical protein B7Y04_13185 [Gallionellales bacterium 24-53-125]OZB09899.1 MAG: hypothetical protein B7X61_05085 [Gallionellales bacterium 39-52-133]HQS57533.1 hypothetical protein [Gallionellaceae bacterium]HQS73987.1 hypothetical protein [Gallionellaceae bacterium]